MITSFKILAYHTASYEDVLPILDAQSQASRKSSRSPDANEHQEWDRVAQFIRANKDRLAKDPDLILSLLSKSPSIGQYLTETFSWTLNAFSIILSAHLSPKTSYEKNVTTLFHAAHYMSDMSTDAFFSLLKPLNDRISAPPVLFPPLEPRYFSDRKLLPVCVPNNFNALDQIKDVRYLKEFSQSLQTVFKEMLGIGVDIYSGFVKNETANARIKKGYLFIENPFVGNMGFHSPSHPFYIFALTQLLSEMGKEIPILEILDILTNDDELWGDLLDLYAPSRFCPHFIGNELMSSPDDPSVATIQQAFRYLYLLSVKGMALRFNSSPQVAVLMMGMHAQNASDFFDSNPAKMEKALAPLCGENAKFLSGSGIFYH
jgi:hypothetical protein